MYVNNFPVSIRLTLSFRGDECYMASTALHTVMADPATAFSEEAKDAALPRAFNTDKACWEWFEEPAQLDRLIRFGVAMEGTAKLEPTELIVKGTERLISVFTTEI